MNINYSDVERLFEVVNAARFKKSKAAGEFFQEISDEEKEEVYRWANGTELSPLVETEGFKIIMGKLERYMDEDIKLLMNTDPASTEDVLARHAVAFSSHRLFQRLSTDVNRDIQASQQPPEIVKEGIRLTRGIPVEAV